MESVASADWAPMFGAFQPVSVKADGAAEPLKVNLRRISPGYFRTLEVPLIEGRELEDSDIIGQSDVVVVDQLLARILWPSQTPIGKRIEFRYPELHQSRVIGVVGPMRQFDIKMPVSESAAVDREALVEHLDSLDAWTGRSLDAPKLYAFLVGLFAAVGLVLIGIGSYGVTRLAVSSKIKEFAIRAALGADVAALRRRSARQAVAMACAGIVLGGATILWWKKALSAFLYKIEATDPWTLSAVALFILLLVVLSAYGATRRLRRLQPSALLRTE